MSQKPLVILHGWSDHADSFIPLRTQLAQLLDLPIHTIILANYISLDDQVTFHDLASAMHQAWIDLKLPLSAQSVDMIVHSTGALICRHWLSQYFNANQTPIDHLLMLAPANFGSFLAHKGRAFLGRLYKGLGHGKPFQVGASLLEGLELGSDFIWALALKDRFGDANFYHAQGVKVTVLIGNQPYEGLAGVISVAGSDGTVQAAAANMNVSMIQSRIDITTGHLRWEHCHAKGQTAFAVVNGFNHTSIVHPQGREGEHLLHLMAQALRVTSDNFGAWCQQLDQQSIQSQQQHMLVQLHDQFQQPIKDYFLGLSAPGASHGDVAQHIHNHLIHSVHINTQQPSRRCFDLDLSRWDDLMRSAFKVLHLAVHAEPVFETQTRGSFGYRTLDDQHHAALSLSRPWLQALYRPGSTTFIDLQLKRSQQRQVFSLNRTINHHETI